MNYTNWQDDDYLPPAKWFLPAVIIFTLVFLGLVISLAHADENYSDEQIVNAIWKSEGGAKATYAYGIRSIPYRTIAEARQICLNTVRNNRKRYARYGHKQYGTYLEFLASRYCPTKGNLSIAEKKLNHNWLRLLRYFLARAK